MNQPAARQVDPTRPDNTTLDTDCDGISDADEIALTYKDATNTDRYTDPADPDTDKDGIYDGVEIGRTAIIEESRCTGFFHADADPTTTTNPVNSDSDGDGIKDGVEDSNHNGQVDPGEADPNTPSSSTTVAACSDANLVPVVFDRSQVADVQLATYGFGEKLSVTVDSEEKGWLYWDPVDQVAAFALKMKDVAGSATALETAGWATFEAMGTISNPLTQSFTTWDGFDAVKATYNWAAVGDAQTLSNAIATTFAGTSATQWSGTAGGPGVAGPWMLRVEYVFRSTATADIVGSFAPASPYTEDVVFKVDDIMNGSAFAQSDDTGSVQCETFQAQAHSKIDILWVVDNSGSMEQHQDAVKRAGNAIAEVLDRSTLDWRMALVTTGHYSTSVPARDLKDFTTDIEVAKTWFAKVPNRWQPNTSYNLGDMVWNQDGNRVNNYRCTDPGTSAGSGGPIGTGSGIDDGEVEWDYDPTWVSTSGNNVEKALLSARKAIAEHFLPVAESDPTKLRSDAKLMIIFLSDTDDQTTDDNLPGDQSTNAKMIDFYKGFFNDYDTHGSSALLNGILCTGYRSDYGPCGDNFPMPTTWTKRVNTVVTDSGGVLATIDDFDADLNTVATLSEMIRTAAGALSPYRLQKDPISVSIKVAMEGPTKGTCNGATNNISDVPRSRVDGFDYYAPTNSILFYGTCRPEPPVSGPGTQIALSYRYWVPGTCPADGCPPTCDPACGQNQLCNEVFTCVCSADCGGTCQTNETCNTTTCTCENDGGY